MPRSNILAVALVAAGIAVLAVFYMMTRPGHVPELVVETPVAPASDQVPGDEPGPYINITVAGEANGEIRIDLLAEHAPSHVAQITKIAEDGSYDGVVFHRVIDGFMAQTGDVQFGMADGSDLQRAGTGQSTYDNIKAEFSDIAFERGMVGMARSQDPNSANSQFFIMFAAGPFLNGEYTVVGKVTEGLDVLDTIKRGHPRSGAVTGAPDVMVSVKATE